MTTNKKHLPTIVLGASQNPARYSYLAIQQLRSHGHPVIAVGKREGQVNDVNISKQLPENIEVDTITLYLNSHNQQQYYEQILALKPKRIIFNPGAENVALAKKAKESNIKPVNACTLVMLSTGQY